MNYFSKSLPKKPKKANFSKKNYFFTCFGLTMDDEKFILSNVPKLKQSWKRLKQRRKNKIKLILSLEKTGD